MGGGGVVSGTNPPGKNLEEVLFGSLVKCPTP